MYTSVSVKLHDGSYADCDIVMETAARIIAACQHAAINGIHSSSVPPQKQRVIINLELHVAPNTQLYICNYACFTFTL